MHLVHVGIQFKGEAGPVKILQALALLRQDGEASLFQQVDLAIFDVAVVQPTHAAEQIAEFHQRDQSSVIARLLGSVVQRHDLAEVGREFPFIGQ